MRRLRLYGTASLPAAFELRDFLARSVVRFDWVDVERDARAAAEVGVVDDRDPRLPIVVFPDGVRLECPPLEEVARRLGWVTEPSRSEYDLSIYGAGPAGLSAAVYAASEGLSTVLVERTAVGGQAGTSSRIENYLGFPSGVSGAGLAERARQQAIRFGAEILLLREGVSLDASDGKFRVALADGGELVARANICATGMKWRRLGLEREEQFTGAGVYYGGAASEGPVCRGEHVHIVGGGNSAGQAAVHLSKFAPTVTMLIRGASPAASMSDYLHRRLLDIDNVEILTHREVVGLEGDEALESIDVRDNVTGTVERKSTRRLFVHIGGLPNTDWAEGTGLVRDEGDYLVTGPDLRAADLDPRYWGDRRTPSYLEASLPGFFAVGDVRHGSVKRVASAVGEGAMAVQFVHRYLNENHRAVAARP